MIAKELDVLSTADKFAKAGRTAEEQMVYYLRRAFKDDKNIYVFNDLRLEQEQEAAQIDHLILHRYGATIVESKSVTTRIQVNEQGEWSRSFNGSLKGMPSPVLQAQRQAEFLRKYLNAQSEMLLGKMLGFRQSTFRNMPLDILVAISDSTSPTSKSRFTRSQRMNYLKLSSFCSSITNPPSLNLSKKPRSLIR